MDAFPNHSYSVSLRIEGKKLLPARISAELGLTPSYTREDDEPRGKTGKFHEGLWSYSAAKQPDELNLEWSSLEDGLLSLINELMPKRELIRRYANEFDVCWWFGHFQKSLNGGPSFSQWFLKSWLILAFLFSWTIIFLKPNRARRSCEKRKNGRNELLVEKLPKNRRHRKLVGTCGVFAP
jgi:hypothetical protein